ncbi:MAG: hypothetical protein HC771_14885 [Synechococcales cyanobacterium CRU_2_2]|nr:hypothetical protein [Synechococcales cyanobacterium CRU_2_2]
MKRYLSLLLLGSLLVLPLAACGSAPSGGDSATPAAEETPEETPATTP